MDQQIAAFLPDLSPGERREELARYLKTRRGQPGSRATMELGLRSWLVSHPGYRERVLRVARDAWRSLVPTEPPAPITTLVGSAFKAAIRSGSVLYGESLRTMTAP